MNINTNITNMRVKVKFQGASTESNATKNLIAENYNSYKYEYKQKDCSIAIYSLLEFGLYYSMFVTL